MNNKIILKIAVISPYYNESDEMLLRCINSVRSQSVDCDHFLISDGLPKQWIDDEHVRHIRLGKSHSDYGNTPRGLGAQLAISEDYDAICFLDADNWFDSDHIETCINSMMSKYYDWIDCDFVVAKRRFCRIDLSVMNIKEEINHIDTNCYFFLRGSHFLLSTWNLIAKDLSSVGDRIFYRKIIAEKLNFVENSKETVNYLDLWASHYALIGESPPIGAKKNVSTSKSLSNFEMKSEKLKLSLKRNMGIRSKNK
jgi:hypothetical protein